MCIKITRLVVLVGELLKYLRLPSRHSGEPPPPPPPPMGHALCLVITSRLMEKDYGVRQGTGGLEL